MWSKGIKKQVWKMIVCYYLYKLQKNPERDIMYQVCGAVQSSGQYAWHPGWGFPGCMSAKLLQLHPSFCDPVDCSQPGFSVHGILLARTLEWVAISFSKMRYYIDIIVFIYSGCIKDNMCFPGGTSNKKSTCQCRRQKRHSFHPWVGKIPWRRAWQPTPVFMPEESHE